MKCESKVLAANQMLSSCLCFFKIVLPSPSWIFVLPAGLISLVFATYLVLGFGFLSIFLYTTMVLLFSTIFCSCTTASNHHKPVCVVGETKSSMAESSDQREDIAEAKDEEEEDGDNSGEEKMSYYAEESSDQREDVIEKGEEIEDEESKNGGGSGVNNNNYSTRLPDSGSKSESHHQVEMLTSEETEKLDYWPLDRSIASSDGSISDEESLIEIALPTGHCSLKQKQHSLMMMELLAEYNFDMNEEDNLIEIDISMGSIKSYSSSEKLPSQALDTH